MSTDSTPGNAPAASDPYAGTTNPFLRSFVSYIPSSSNLREFTWLPLVVGTLLGMVFGASSLYLVLKVGLTVSASIPVAVISITLFRLLHTFGLRNATILENNIVQTAGSAGESIAFGVGVTMPAILILGFDLELTRVMLVAVLGGLLGILMMIPLRRALIVQQHGYLKYPEGTACAEVLKAGASDESRAAADDAWKAQEGSGSAIGARTIFAGFGIGFAYQVAMAALKGWKDVPEKIFGAPFKSGSIAAEISPALLGVGYIIGPRIASIMCAGGVLAYLVLIPAIKFFGEGMTTVLAPGQRADRRDGAERNSRRLRALHRRGSRDRGRHHQPLPFHARRSGTGSRAGSTTCAAAQAANDAAVRTDKDLPMSFVIGGIITLVIAIVITNELNLQWNLLGAFLIIAFGFLFVTVSSRLTGEIGSSSNPISGMTVATLLLTCLIFLIIGWTRPVLLRDGPVDRRDRLHRRVERRHDVAGSQDGLPRRRHAAAAADRDPRRRARIGAHPRSDPAEPQQRVDGLRAAHLVRAGDRNGRDRRPGEARDAAGAHRRHQAVPARRVPRPAESDRRDRGARPGRVPRERVGESRLPRPQELHAGAQDRSVEADRNGRAPGSAGGGGRQDVPRLVQAGQRRRARGPVPRQRRRRSRCTSSIPGINGTHRVRPDDSKVDKFDAPKATLMSYIIKGILNQELPWGLVLLGVMISVVLEMSGIPSLAFAVGVYLPLSSSSPIFIGGMVRWLVDRNLRKKLAHKDLTEDQLVAEGDKSPGVLMASGYIAGGAIAGIVIAFMAGVLTETNRGITDWSTENNPFFNGPNADLLSMIPFVLLVALLYFVGREWLLGGKKETS